jgi:ubiquitin carboxyl-terminal hydrolase 4/11/15
VPTITKNQQLDNNEVQEQIKAIQISRLSIPKYGTIGDICIAVAKAVNESGVLKHTVDPDKLIVADVYNHRFHKRFTNEESYSAQLDEIVVYETLERHHSVPVYLRELKSDDTTTLFGRPFIINVNDSNYETVYEAVTQQLRHFMKIPLSEEESDSDEGVAECERTDRFTLTLVNSYGSLDIEKLDRTKPLELDDNKTYLAVDLPTRMKNKYYNESEIENPFKLPTQKQTNNSGKTSLPLSECISQFTTTEKLGADDPWYCPKCKKHQMASKKFDLWLVIIFSTKYSNKSN